jgi:hypothetical protein
LTIACALALLGAAAPVFAQGQPGCVALCAVSCIKPISIPDRWDDTTPIAGYAGEIVNGKRMPNWRLNNAWNSERVINDVNANGLYDPGDSYEDLNGNGMYDAEAYDPLTIGYNTGSDLGLEITFRGSIATSPSAGRYYPIALPAVNRGTPIPDSDVYRANWSSCGSDLLGAGDRCALLTGSMTGPTNTAMREVIATDPDAYWDPATSTVKGSQFAQSPRIIFLPVHDPRVPVFTGGPRLQVTKIVAFFMEQMEGNAEVRGRFLRAIGTGETCPAAGDGFVVECPTPAQPTSWGRVKNLYR